MPAVAAPPSPEHGSLRTPLSSRLTALPVGAVFGGSRRRWLGVPWRARISLGVATYRLTGPFLRGGAELSAVVGCPGACSLRMCGLF